MMEQRPKVVRDIFLICVLLHNILRTHQGGLEKAPIPVDDIVAIANEPVVYAPDENYRNPPRKAEHQVDLLKDYFNHIGSLAEQEDRI